MTRKQCQRLLPTPSYAAAKLFVTAARSLLLKTACNQHLKTACSQHLKTACHQRLKTACRPHLKNTRARRRHYPLLSLGMAHVQRTMSGDQRSTHGIVVHAARRPPMNIATQTDTSIASSGMVQQLLNLMQKYGMRAGSLLPTAWPMMKSLTCMRTRKAAGIGVARFVGALPPKSTARHRSTRRTSYCWPIIKYRGGPRSSTEAHRSTTACSQRVTSSHRLAASA